MLACSVISSDSNKVLHIAVIAPPPVAEISARASAEYTNNFGRMRKSAMTTGAFKMVVHLENIF